MLKLKVIYSSIDEFLNRHPFLQAALGASTGILIALYIARHFLGFSI